MLFQGWSVTERIARLRESYQRVGGCRVAVDRHDLFLDTHGAGDAMSPGETRNFQLEVPTDADWYWFSLAGDITETIFAIRDRCAELMLRFQLDRRSHTLGRHRKGVGLDAVGWIPAETVASRATGDPFYWPYPVGFRGADTIGVTFFVPGSAPANVAIPRLTFGGYKFYVGNAA